MSRQVAEKRARSILALLEIDPVSQKGRDFLIQFTYAGREPYQLTSDSRVYLPSEVGLLTGARLQPVDDV